MEARLQSEAAECGLACVAYCSAVLGAEHQMATLRSRFPSSTRGVSVQQIVTIAHALDLDARAVRCEPEDLASLALPAILHWGHKHFVVLTRVTARGVWIYDPALGKSQVGYKQLSSQFTGVAVELRPTSRFRKRKEASPLSLWSLLDFRGGAGAALGYGILCTLFLQLFVLLGPYFLQLAIDEATVQKDSQLLVSLAVGFAFVAVLNSGTEFLRGIALQQASALLGWNMSSKLFRQQMRLPLEWFQRRKLADILSRQDSIDPIRQLMSQGFATSLLDGLLVASTLVMMAIYSGTLFALAALTIALQVTIKLVAAPASVRRGSLQLQASINERGARIETLRSIQTIKVMGGEREREATWSARYSEVVRANQASATLLTATNALRTLVEGISLVATVALGAKCVMQGALTIGALYAFIAYRGQAMARVGTLVDSLLAWRITSIHTDRIADIALATPEPASTLVEEMASPPSGRLTLRNVVFRHSPSEPTILKGVTFDVEPGEFVAITGESGCGKSTLLKLVSGLYAPTHGDIEIDGMRLDASTSRLMRSFAGVVMQDDSLMPGTVLDNVTFFAEVPDHAQAVDCLKQAAIYDEIMALPMRLETPLGDMGVGLSGGQKQRLLLARALYRRPRFLILDEATSHLDVKTERLIHHTLREMRSTRIVVTHRTETLAYADRVIKLRDGRVGLNTLVRSGPVPSAVSPGDVSSPAVAP